MRKNKKRQWQANSIFFLLICKIILFFFFYANASAETNIDLLDSTISNTHPRIFITSSNKSEIRDKAYRIFSQDLSLLTKRIRHDKIPKGLRNLSDYIYKYGYLYQITGELQWANLAIKAMEQFPASLIAYGGANNGYGYALEGLAIGFDWCYMPLQQAGKAQNTISLINAYYIENRKNLHELPDFHNYAGQAEIAMLLAGLATYGENPEAPRYLSEARNIMEHGETRNGIYYNVKDSIAFVDGASNWEGVTYQRKPLFSYIKYIEALRTASNGKINLWEDETFSSLENAGYYIMYSLRSDNLFENIGDVNYRTLSYFDINNLSALQSTFKNPYFTAFLNKHAKWKKSKKEKGGVWPGQSWAPVIFYLMWYNPDISEAKLEELPLSKKFGDVIIIRNGFGESDTHITFKSGFHYGLHTQLDHGSFTIFKHSPLAIDSGYYDNWKWGKRHIWNYWKRTIAHNTLLIYNPEDKPFTYPKNNKRKVINDGGQRFPFMRFFPPHVGIGSSHHPKSVDYIKKKSDEFSMGKITEYESQDDYVFISTDLTNAYDNAYSGWGTNPAKRVNSVERQFLYLKSDQIIIYDKIDALSEDFEKIWLLHSGSFYDKANKPELNGTLKLLEGTYDAGITESLDADMFMITNGDAQLLVKTLLPYKHKTRRIGGENFEFWVQGENQPIGGKGILDYRKDEDPGAWRVEISPIEPSNYDEFLHVLIPSHKNSTLATQINKIVTESDNATGVHIKDEKNNWIVVFSKFKSSHSENIKYTFNNSVESQHIITGLSPKTYYSHEQSTSNGINKIKIQKSINQSGIMSSSEGVLFMTIPPTENN